MEQSTIDILMITYNRPYYTRLSLKQLLDTCDETMRIWIWHNGNDGPTLDIVRSMASHPRVHEFYISPENKKLNEPTNWLWTNAKGDYFSKVDDDCLLPNGWAQTLQRAHEDVPEFGVIGCWRFLDEDFFPEIANKKIKEFSSGHKLMANCWIEGSGYLMKRECVKSLGLLDTKFDRSRRITAPFYRKFSTRNAFNTYCIGLARKGWINGWYYPFIYQEHMDDPRTPHTEFKSDEDFRRFRPLTALSREDLSLDDWLESLKRSAKYLQEAPTDVRYYSWYMRILRKFLRMTKPLRGKT